MARLLICDSDQQSIKMISDILKLRDGHTVMLATDKGAAEVELGNKEKHVIYQTSGLEAALELIKQTAFDLLFFNVSVIDDKIDKWVTKIRKQAGEIKENQTAPLVLMGKDEDPDQLRKYMTGGFSEYLSLPLDNPIFIQKFDFLLMGKIDTSNRQLYNLPTNKPIDVATPHYLEEISEFGAIVNTNQPVKVNDFVLLRNEAFADSGRGEVIGRCYAVVPHPTMKGFFQASFVFFGVNHNHLKNIRKWIRTEYARKKSDAA